MNVKISSVQKRIFKCHNVEVRSSNLYDDNDSQIPHTFEYAVRISATYIVYDFRSELKNK
jgi:hypothetical protein